MLNHKIINKDNCTHKEPCNINKYGQCVCNFVLYCQICNYGLRNMYDKCKNNDCSQYLKNNTIADSKEDISEENILKQNIAEETSSIKKHEYFHYGDSISNKYEQCKKGWKYFCC